MKRWVLARGQIDDRVPSVGTIVPPLGYS